MTRRLTLAAILILCATFVIGCTHTRVVFVRPGVPVKIGPDVRGKVYYLDAKSGEWTLSERTVTIPEGWLCVSPRDEEN